MSPRSEEFLEQARERLADAEKILPLLHPAVAVTTAYYAMLNAARALSPSEALREDPQRHLDPLQPGDRELSALARRAQEARQQGDHEAAPASAAEAVEFVEGAARFIAAVEDLIG
jgi:hypothetical protein